jgi:hypothetical protein
MQLAISAISLIDDIQSPMWLDDFKTLSLGHEHEMQQ